MFRINFSKAKTKFCLSLHYNGGKSYLFVNRKEIYEFKANNKNVNFQTQFYLGSMSNKFYFIEPIELSFQGNVYSISVDYNAIDKSDVLNSHKYIIVKNNIK